MTSSETTDVCPVPSPRCARCGAALVLVALPVGAPAPPEGRCVDCGDGTPVAPVPWACPRCGLVSVREAP